MTSVTLAESAKLAQDELVAGVIEQIITVNQMFEVLPFDSIDGNSLAYNRENVLGDVQVAGVGDSITAKGAATFTKKNVNLTKIIGDAEVDNMIQATRSGNGNDQKAVQVASKAKSCGRKYQDMLINGSGSANEFEGLILLCASDQKVDTGGNGSALSFEIMDNLIDLVTDKDGSVDYIVMPARTRRAYRALLRALGGTSMNDVVVMPSGGKVEAYNGVPVFRNDYIPTDQTKGGSSNTTTIFAGTLDDGSRSHGIAGITAANAAGINVVEVGEKETADETITRVKWYCSLACFSLRGLSAAEGITN